MFICQWHIEVPFGKQGEATNILKEWASAMEGSGKFQGVLAHRVLVGHVGPSPSRVIAEWEFQSLSDWERAIEAVGEERFQEYSARIAPLIVPGSQHWEIWRPVD
jgi:hypothetical protein